MSYRSAALIAASLFIAAGSLGCPAADDQAAAPEEHAAPRPKLAEIAAASRPAGAADPAEAAQPAAGVIEAAYAGTTPPESVQMLLTILRGQTDAGGGWYGPGVSRYSWQSLTAMHGKSGYDPITADEFPGTDEWFKRLDRDGDGRIAVSDLDWSDGNDWVRSTALVDPGPMELTQADMPTQEMRIRALFAGDFGSLNEGPAVDERAPDFSLKTHDGAATVRLADLLAEGKPVVLTFGNFTCGPFRHTFPAVEAVRERFAGEATFVAVYVRETHPSDGWRMSVNDRAGISTAQPTTYAERVEVANLCHALLKPVMPLLVDEINDPVGHAYSGMPARLYVIDPAGRVAYKGGRGPFGFKPAEMEQALVLTLLEQKMGAAHGTGEEARGPNDPAAQPLSLALD